MVGLTRWIVSARTKWVQGCSRLPSTVEVIGLFTSGGEKHREVCRRFDPKRGSRPPEISSKQRGIGWISSTHQSGYVEMRCRGFAWTGKLLRMLGTGSGTAVGAESEIAPRSLALSSRRKYFSSSPSFGFTSFPHLRPLPL